MKKKLFTILSLVALMGVGVLSSCGEKKVESVSIDPADCQTVKVGGTVQFKAEVLPADAANKNVTWSVSDSKIGTVNETGLFTALAVGDATVTVTTKDGNKTASCDVIVDPAPTPKTIDSVVIDPHGTKTVKVGDEISFKATVTGTNPNKAVLWTVEGTGGTITAQGKFTATTVGTATIKCTSYVDATKSDTCVVTVEAKPTPTPTIDSVTINPRGTQSIVKGQSIDFTATVTGTQTDKSVVWSVEGTGGSIDQQGHFTSTAAGQVTVKAVASKDSTKSDTCIVTITEPTPTPTIDSVTISPRGTSTATVGGNINFTVQVTGSEQDKSVEWTVSDTSKASITQAGVFTASAVGEVTVTATAKKDSSKKDTCVVTISESPTPTSTYTFSYSAETASNPITMVKNAGKENEYMLPSGVNLSADFALQFKYGGNEITVSPKPGSEANKNNVRVESDLIFPHNDASNANVYLDVSDTSNYQVWVEGYQDAPPAEPTYKLSLNDTPYDLIKDTTSINTYKLNETISVTGGSTLKFYADDVEITSNIFASADDVANKKFNNVEGGKITWDATGANIYLHVNDSSYTYWVDGGHSFPTNGYYLMGNQIGWTPRYATVQGVETETNITFTRVVESGAEFKVAYVQDGAISDIGWHNPATSSTGCEITQDGNIKITASGQHKIVFTKEAVTPATNPPTYKYEVTKEVAALTLAYKINNGSYVDFPAPTSVTEGDIEYFKYTASIQFAANDAINFFVKQGTDNYTGLVTPLDFFRPYKEFTIDPSKEGMICKTAGTYNVEIYNPKTASKGIFKIVEGTFDPGYYLATNLLNWNLINADGFFFGEIPQDQQNITVNNKTLNGSATDDFSYKFVHLDAEGNKAWKEFNTDVADNAIDGVSIKIDTEHNNNAKVLVDSVYVNYIITANDASLTKAYPTVKYVDKNDAEHDCTRDGTKYALTAEAGAAFAVNDTIRIKVDGVLDDTISIGDTTSFSVNNGIAKCLKAGTYKVVYDLSSHALVITNKAITSDYYLRVNDGEIVNLTKNGEKEGQYDSPALTLSQSSIIKIYDVHDAVLNDFVLKDDVSKMFLESIGDSISAKANCKVTLFIKAAAKEIYATTQLADGYYKINNGSVWAAVEENKVSDLPVAPATEVKINSDVASGDVFKFVKVNNGGVVYLPFEALAEELKSNLSLDEHGNLVVQESANYDFYLKTNPSDSVYVGVPAPTYTFTYSEGTESKPVTLVQNPENVNEYMLEAGVSLSASHSLDFFLNGNPITVTPKTGDGNNAKVIDNVLFPINDANNANVYLDVSNPSAYTVWVDGYVAPTPYTVSFGSDSYKLVAHATEANTYVLKTPMALTADQNFSFAKNGTAITSNINPDADDNTNRIYNNVLNGKVCWSATSANIYLHVNGDNYTYWIEGGHAFPTDGYYLFGSEITWDARFASVQGKETADKIVYNRVVTANEEFKVVYVYNGVISSDGWHNADDSSTGCTVTSDKNIKIAEAGQYAITFNKAEVGTKTYKYEVVAIPIFVTEYSNNNLYHANQQIELDLASYFHSSKPLTYTANIGSINSNGVFTYTPTCGGYFNVVISATNGTENVDLAFTLTVAGQITEQTSKKATINTEPQTIANIEAAAGEAAVVNKSGIIETVVNIPASTKTQVLTFAYSANAGAKLLLEVRDMDNQFKYCLFNGAKTASGVTGQGGLGNTKEGVYSVTPAQLISFELNPYFTLGEETQLKLVFKNAGETGSTMGISSVTVGPQTNLNKYQTEEYGDWYSMNENADNTVSVNGNIVRMDVKGVQDPSSDTVLAVYQTYLVPADSTLKNKNIQLLIKGNAEYRILMIDSLTANSTKEGNQDTKTDRISQTVPYLYPGATPLTEASALGWNTATTEGAINWYNGSSSIAGHQIMVIVMVKASVANTYIEICDGALGA